ncbi:MAG: heavy-metal-associated domain-containing protein [Fimbriimonadia bacterium]|nr:heavy-metal-associated domain-containing protein [Fimbriimonadia bacterium]
MKTLFLLLICLLWIPAACQRDEDRFVVVTVQGTAPVEQNRNPEPVARNEAKRAAVEQVIGAYVRSDTQVEGSRLLYDTIISKVEGYAVVIAGPLQPRQVSGIYSADYQVKVFLQRLGAPRGLLEELQERGLFRAIRTMILIPDASPAEESAVRALSDYGFKMIDSQFLRLSLREDRENLHDNKRWLARLRGVADLAIIGDAHSGSVPRPSLARDSRFVSYRAQVTLRAIWVDTGEVIASASARGIPVADLNDTIARDRALSQAAEQAARELMPKILQANAFSPGKVSRLIELEVTGISNYSDANHLRAFLEKMEGVQEIVRFQYDQGRVVCELNVSENGKTAVADRLDQWALSRDWLLRVKSVSENKIEIETIRR